MVGGNLKMKGIKYSYPHKEKVISIIRFKIYHSHLSVQQSPYRQGILHIIYPVSIAAGLFCGTLDG